MVQGTMSGAGKSLIVTALCRIFKQDGYRVAPFKSQNMALNSFVTKDGFEMGRAQAVQAYAAGLEPDVRMNPILLKPSSETGSQVILNGRIYAQLGAVDYYNRKKQLLPEVVKAYESLAKENEIIVIEGAGSPAEINLRKDDIVNMGLAEVLDAKVLLVGDIDPGGVFAQLYGTVMLLSEKERERIAGLIINKFRGDPKLLKPGLKQLTELTGLPVFGVIPFTSVKIEEEDSLSDELKITTHDKPIDIAIIRLPFISNYTDFTVIEQSKLMGIRYVTESLSLGRPDLIILPGSKSTINDLNWLRETGLEQAILALYQNGSELLGICGGYQMLGNRLLDPETCEEAEGLGLLPVDTEFLSKKTTRQVIGEIAQGSFAGAKIKGYEIHTGRTTFAGERFFSRLRIESAGKGSESEIEDGCIGENVYGTYVHGLFDSGELIERMTEHFMRKRGLPFVAAKAASTDNETERGEKSRDFRAFQEEQYDILADAVRNNIDLKRIYRELHIN